MYRWYKSNPITIIPPDDEIKVLSTKLNHPPIKIKKFLCEKLNISYNSLSGVKTRNYDNATPSMLQQQQQQPVNLTTAITSNNNNNILSSSSSNAVMSSSTASSSIPSSSSLLSSQKQPEKEQEEEKEVIDVNEVENNKNTYQVSFLSANSSISGVLASLGKSGLAKSNSLQKNENENTSVSAVIGYSDNGNGMQNTDTN